MYHIAVSFDVPAERREEFIAAALKDGRDSAADEPGTRRFELIVDADDPNRFYLNEAYDDEAAFDVHAEGPHFARFFEVVQGFAKGPEWLIKGTRVEPEEGAGRLTVIAAFKARPGREDELRTALDGMVEPSLKEEGCLAYAPYADPSRPGRMLLVEEWTGKKALDLHFGTAHFKEVSRVLDDVLAEPFTVRLLNEA